MKNLYLLVCILATGLIFTSCKKENKKSTSESSIMGKWKGEKMISSISMNGLVVETDTSYWEMPDYLAIEFKKNNQMVSHEFSDNELDTDVLYYSVKGNKITIMDDEDDSDVQEFTFKADKNKLVLSNSSFEMGGGVTYSLEIHLKR